MTATLHRHEKNTYKLPRGTPLRRELVKIFAEQRRAILAYIETGEIENKAFDVKEFSEADHPRDEEGRFASTGASHHFGKSKAKIKFGELGVANAEFDVRRLFGKGVTPHDLSSIVGATDDAVCTYDSEETKRGPTLTIITKHKNYRSDRTIQKDKNGKIYIKAERFDVVASERGKGNYGPQVFGRMVENAIAAGVDRIMTDAARSDFQNGYYTWARFGYDAPLDDHEKAKLPEALKSASRVSDLMESEEGRSWWKANGDTKTMKFDLKPGSRSLKVWAAYLEAKANSRISPGKIWFAPTSHGQRFATKDDQIIPPIPRPTRPRRRNEQGRYLPWHWPTWHEFRLGALKMAERMTPIISATWDRAGSFFASQVGLDPDHWSVVNSHTAQKIQMAALDFCRETNATTSDDLDAALAKTRQQLQEGIVDEGESVEQLTKRVNAVFDQASKSRARAIAQTETSRAVHAAQEDAAMHSGIVTGWKWLASSDACDVCLAIAARAPTVKLGQPFAIIGTNPTYAKIMYPPAHPHCNCTVTEVLDTDKQPTFHPTLDQPEAVTQSEAEAHAAETRRSYEEIWAGSVAWGAKPRKGIKAKSIRKAKSLPRIKRKVFTSTQ